MIKDEEIGLEIAEDEEEAFLNQVVEKAELAAVDLDKQLRFNTLVLDAAKAQLALRENRKDLKDE